MSLKAERTHHDILDTALEHFLRDGFSGASLRNIVKDCGLTTGAFYKYYPTKESLLDALVDPYVNHIYEIYDTMLANFENLSAAEQTQNMSDSSGDGITQMIDYIYENYDHFRLLYKCGDTGKYESFIHGMVQREINSTAHYIEAMRSAGVNLPKIDDVLIHMIYTGFFSGVFQIIEHHMDKESALKHIQQLKEFQTGGWERLFQVEFPGA